MNQNSPDPQVWERPSPGQGEGGDLLSPAVIASPLEQMMMGILHTTPTELWANN